MDNKEKLNLDDITFDSFIDGNVSTTSEESVASDVAIEEPQDTKVEEESKSEKIEDIEENEEEIDEIEEETVEETVSASDDEVEATTTEPADTAVVNEVLSNLGYEMEGEYDDTVEGLTTLTKDVASTMAEEQLDNLFDQFPEIQKHLEYVLSGGDSTQFYQMGSRMQSISNANITEDNALMQKAVLTEYFRVKGHEDDFIVDLLNDYESNDKLYTQSVKAKEALVKYENARQDEIMQQQKQAQEQQQEEAREFWENVNSTIQDSREFSGIVVQERDKKKFFDYISKPIDSQGNTKRDLDHSEADMDIRLAIDYLMFKGFKLDDIIKAKAKTETAKTLRKQIRSNKTTSVKGAKGVGKSKSTDLDNLDLSLTSL